MQTWQGRWDGAETVPVFSEGKAQLVLVHGPSAAMTPDAIGAIQAAHPDAHVVGCSGAGEIMGESVSDDALVLTGVTLEKATIEVVAIELAEGEDSTEAGRRVAGLLPTQGLVHALVFSDGLAVNGTALVDGMTETLPAGVTLTGGLAGDGADFKRTVVAARGTVGPGRIAVIGFYGAIAVGYGSLGGWDTFGPRRIVTRSEGNVVHELDGRPALDLYKEYLGEHAEGLPSTGLLYPLHLPEVDGSQGVVRTILAVDEGKRSMTFAGDVPQGAEAQLMRANFDRLVEGAETAAERSESALGGDAELAILISCVGRKLVLKQRVEDELDAVRDVIGPQATMAGFYSYGEICPAAADADCRLHNQTMTITTLRET